MANVVLSDFDSTLVKTRSVQEIRESLEYDFLTPETIAKAALDFDLVTVVPGKAGGPPPLGEFPSPCSTSRRAGGRRGELRCIAAAVCWRCAEAEDSLSQPAGGRSETGRPARRRRCRAHSRPVCSRNRRRSNNRVNYCALYRPAGNCRGRPGGRVGFCQNGERLAG